ncbi:Futalosine hydrolase [Limnoglobus roseus]|uniref:Futalosine hydrolase n=2 Tax=Limnoglobus roseus TaxID=2598579 RepID=A0A5C1AAK8_9BACT|nr:Futalosine hydrolase [Limnoglobus roseus]
MDREAAPFRKLAKRGRLPVRVLVAGMGLDAAKRAAEGVGDAALVISAGFCGALNPALKVGDVLTCALNGDAVAAPALRSESPALPRNGRLLTVPHLVATPHEKRELRDRTAADVVDMEAAAVADVCASRGLSFLAVKAVSDTADTALSPRLVNLLAGGRVSPLKAAAAIIVQPSILWEFQRLARDTKRAAEQLAIALHAVVRSRPSVEPIA